MTRYLTIYAEINGIMQLGFSDAAYLKFNEGEDFGWGVSYTTADEKQYDREGIGQHDRWAEITKPLADYLVKVGNYIKGDEAKEIFDKYMHGFPSASAKEPLPCNKDWEKHANDKRDEIFRRMSN